MNTGSRRGPTLLRHKRSGRGYAKFNGRQVWFGPFDDRETHAEFAAYKARWEANGRELPDESEVEECISVEALCDQYEAHLERRHDERWIVDNLTRVKLALTPLRALYGPEDASTFSPLRLQAVREKMLATEKLCRGEINDRVQIIRRAFKWAVAQEKLPPDRAHGLAAVEPLRAGEFGAREGRKVGPVAEDVVWATLPYLGRTAAAVVELLWWTGARPSEVLGLRPKDIDRSGKVWVVRLQRHKNARKGKRRELYFGQRAQAVLRPFLDRVPKPTADRPLFSPAEAEAERNRERRRERKTPLYPSHVERYERQRKADPKRSAGEVYTATALRKAVDRAIAALNRDRVERGKRKLPRWHPYQLRHAAASRLRKEHGLEMVRCLLGHSSAEMSEVYAEVDLEKARQLMEAAG